MLTIKQNFLETIRGGSPDRFVNQFEPFALIYGFDPLNMYGPPPVPGMSWVDPWGVSFQFAEGTPGPMPVLNDDTVVLKDITTWRETVKAPSLEFSAEAWAPSREFAATVDREQQYLTLTMFGGLFERLHYLMDMEECLISFITEPEEMHALLDYLVDFEIDYATLLIDELKPDALYHHDDWGSSKTTMLSPAMFAEFLLPVYKRLYGFFRQNGIEIIVHHSDSYAATLVPHMIEMGIDVWQGCISTNNVPELIKTYGGQISFMGNIDNQAVDVPNWTPELIRSVVENACRSCGKLYYIPNTVMGGPVSSFPGVYETVSTEIDRMSKEMF